MTTEPHARDVVDALIEDHREVEELFQRLEAGEGTPQERQDMVSVVIAELVRHSEAEEQFLYPTAREKLAGGDETTDHEIAEHRDAEQVMKDLEARTPDDPEFDRLLRTLIDDIRHHIAEEESDLFPKLRETCTGEDLRKLGNMAAAAKVAAPTRPHPSAPDRPPANQLLAPGVGLVDRIRDALEKRPTRPSDL